MAVIDNNPKRTRENSRARVEIERILNGAARRMLQEEQAEADGRKPEPDPPERKEGDR